LAILRDGKFLALCDLLEQVRECGLGFFNGDCLHLAKNVTSLPAQGQPFRWKGEGVIIWQ
jgi:hypothetical protein